VRYALFSKSQLQLNSFEGLYAADSKALCSRTDARHQLGGYGVMKTWIWLLAVCYSGASLATTWSEKEVDDPIVDGAKCHVHVPLSYGSYIYHWPSKYDQVFWPLVDELGLWFCEESGFVAFISDFDGLAHRERKEIHSFLENNYAGSADTRKKLELLEGIYALREKDSAFSNMLNRVLARWYQDLEEYDKANEYREVALGQIRSQLNGELSDEVRLEYLYVACNYDVFFGNGSSTRGCGSAGWIPSWPRDAGRTPVA
jgi:hypothetical protein